MWPRRMAGSSLSLVRQIRKGKQLELGFLYALDVVSRGEKRRSEGGYFLFVGEN